MDNNTYTYKQLLIGLRSEYLKAKEELEKLNKSIDCFCDSKYAHSFSLVKIDKETKLMLEAVRVKKDIIYKIKNILQIMNIIEKEQTRTQMIKDKFGLYIPKETNLEKDNEKFEEIFIVPKKQNEFTKTADKLLDSDFVKYIQFNEEEYSNIKKVVKDANIWDFSNYSQVFTNHELNLEYDGLKDIITLSSVFNSNENAKPITCDILKRALNTKFSKDIFSDYHKNLIEQGLTKQQDIVFSSAYYPSTYSKFMIEEKEKALVLHKVNY